MDLLFERGKIGLQDLFEVAMKVAIGDRVSTLRNIRGRIDRYESFTAIVCHIAILKHIHHRTEDDCRYS